jgi:hypothetical protein
VSTERYAQWTAVRCSHDAAVFFSHCAAIWPAFCNTFGSTFAPAILTAVGTTYASTNQAAHRTALWFSFVPTDLVPHWAFHFSAQFGSLFTAVRAANKSTICAADWHTF